MSTTTAAKSPTYLVNIETTAGKPQLSSEIEGFEAYGPVYKSEFYFEKKVATDAGADLFASATVSASSLIIAIEKGGYISDLQNTFMQTTPIEQITLITLANIDGTNKKRDCVIFNNCYLIRLEEKIIDKIEVMELELRYTKYTHTVFQYTQNGDEQGQTESTFDLTKNTTG